MVTKTVGLLLMAAALAISQPSFDETAVRKGPGYVGGRVGVVNQNGELESALGVSIDCVRVDGTSVRCGSPLFADSEVPAGVVDGTNLTFTLANTPSPIASLKLYRNGLLLRAGADYELNGVTITFHPEAAPQPGDLLQAHYRFGDTIPLRSLLSSTGVRSLMQAVQGPASAPRADYGVISQRLLAEFIQHLSPLIFASFPTGSEPGPAGTTSGAQPSLSSGKTPSEQHVPATNPAPAVNRSHTEGRQERDAEVRSREAEIELRRRGVLSTAPGRDQDKHPAGGAEQGPCDLSKSEALRLANRRLEMHCQ